MATDAARRRMADEAVWRDPAARARILAHQAHRARRARILARYGRLIGEAARRGDLTHSDAMARIMAAQERLP